MFKNMWYFLALCLLAVKAQSNGDGKSSETLAVNGSETKKVESANISALYIGDLLRTKPKEVLEASGSAHRPVVSQPIFLSPSPVAGRTFRYKAHGGHEYVVPEYRYPSTASGASPIERVGNRATGNPVSAMAHLLTLKPVRVVSADALPAARNSRTHHKSDHYSNDDCSKSGDHSYSSEEKPYIPEQRSYRRAKQTAPVPEPEYRSRQRSYDEDEGPVLHYSHTDPSTARYNSKTHSADSNSKSLSSGSYTKSKSTSTSRTINPNRSKEKVRIIPSTVSQEKDYEKNLGAAHGNSKVVVYKVKEPSSSSRPGSYSDRDYPPSNYESGHNSGHQEQQYEQHSRPVKQSGEAQTYSTTEQQSPKKRPRQYAPAPYEQDRDSYEQTSYTPAEEPQYGEQNKPSTSYHPEPEYNSQPNTRGQEPKKPYYQSYPIQESPVRYEAEQPSKTHSSKRHRSQHYERPSNEGRESSGYRTPEPSTPKYTYPPQQIQSSRSRKERPQSSYESYSSPDIYTESAPASQSYERNHPTLRPSEEKQMNQYAYEATPHHSNDKHNNPKREHKESARSARSPGKYGKSVIEERANFPGRGNEKVVLVSRESQPYVSRSVSYSESSYNMGENQSPKVKAQEQVREQSTQERQAGDRDYQTSYKPYNSEYPASYANDQQGITAEQHESQTYDLPYDQPHSPHEETPQQYQPYDEEEPYEQDGSQGSDDSYEQGGPPAKKGKTHHYISKIEGYKDTYGSNEPLTIDEEFFRKYGISKTAKVIVASAKDPNLFVADGSNIKEGDYFADSEPINEGSYEPNYKSSFKEDTSSESPEELGVPREVPGSFDDLVDTNPKFLRNLPKIMNPSSGHFNMDDSEASFDDIEFRDSGEPKGFVVSQGPGEIVQQHGDGVSRILYNIPRDESKSESSTRSKVIYEERNDEKFESSASKVIEKSVKPES